MCFCDCFRGENFFKITNLFVIFAERIARKLLYHCGKFFFVLYGKSSDHADMDFSKFYADLYRRILSDAVKRGKDMSCNRNRNCLRPNGHM